MAIPNEFFTVESMVTLTGATGATFIICNGLQQAFNVNPRQLGLAVAQVIVLGGVFASGGDTAVDYLIGVVNGFLVYASAGGATGALSGQRTSNVVSRGDGIGVGNVGDPHPPAMKRQFLSHWF